MELRNQFKFKHIKLVDYGKNICYHIVMIKNCQNCGGKLKFSPKDKGDKCNTCGTVFPVKYIFNFEKNSFDDATDFTNVIGERPKKDASVKCSSCGATIIYSKLKPTIVCPYCGSALPEQVFENNIKIDSIIPFAFDKKTALKKFKSALFWHPYLNRKVFKKLTEKDVKTSYLISFVFDLTVSCGYTGTFSYTMHNDDDGTSDLLYRNVSGLYDKAYKNITVEASTNIEQDELFDILPYDYTTAVKFKEDFVAGAMIERQDKPFENCLTIAQNAITKEIKEELLKLHNCDAIENINLNLNYTDKKFNCCLLPVYFINSVVEVKNKKDIKEKKYKAIINGQTGRIGYLPHSLMRYLLTLLSGSLFVIAFILLFVFVF